MLDRQRGEKQHWEQRDEGRGKGDAPGMRAGISMEHMERTMMEDVFHCSLWSTYSFTLQLVEDSTLEHLGVS